MFSVALKLVVIAIVAGPPGLVMNGKTVSSDVKLIGGKPYVSLADMARALGMQVVRTATGYKLVAAGGANEMTSKVQGKIGDDLFTGDWRFSVTGFKTADEYTPVHKADKYAIHPSGPNDVLVVVNCRVKNGHSVKELIQFQNSVGKSDNASLTVEGERAYEPVSCDVHLDYYTYAAYALPGSAIPFSLVFSVPKDSKPKDLVFQIFRYDDRGDRKKWTTVRVSLDK